MENLIKQFGHNNVLTVSALKYIMSISTILEFKKGDEIPNISKHDEWLYIVKEGCVTCSYIEASEGRENILLFFEKGDTFIPTRHNDAYYYYAATDVKVISLKFTDCAHIIIKHPEATTFISGLFKDLLYRTIGLGHLLRIKDPKERYRNMIKNRPGITNILKLKTLANFLDMSPETISRVRNPK